MAMRRVLAMLVLLSACAGVATERAPPERHPVVAGEPAERNAACERCHSTIAGEWRASLHRTSATDPVYARAFALEPLAFCSDCHAPQGDPSIGTACITCHDGRAASMKARPCADCHEFAFPDGHGKMQLTATEHRASGHASTSCADCHMPREGHRSHRFAASRDPALLRRAAVITATRTASTVVVSLVPRDVGHALPTGDIFRRLRIAAAVLGEPRREREVFLGRKTKLGDDRDDRPFTAGGRRMDVRLPLAAPGEPIAWRVVYERVEHPTSDDEADAIVEGAIELASGVLPAP